MRRRALIAMAAYYVATGAWPIVHMASFEAVTGRKVDRWLVKMVGALALANGVVLGLGARREDPSEEGIALAACSALAFTAIDVVYVTRRRIRPVYLADAVVEIALAAAIVTNHRS
jgi:hypothetical protein